tara:strand:- start:137 stop:598 length:462 start_codon:yes stop_codon:yes gene_type:complete
MNYYRKPKPETILKNKETNKKLYSKEIKWIEDNMEHIKSNNFLTEMYSILISGRRKMTPKMIESVRKSMNNSIYDPVERIERKQIIEPILEKINVVLKIVKEKDKNKSSYYLTHFSPIPFIESVKKQLETKLLLSEKQMSALNKIYKRYTKSS